MEPRKQVIVVVSKLRGGNTNMKVGTERMKNRIVVEKEKQSTGTGFI